MTPEERARLICSEFAVVERRHWPALLAHEFRLAMAEEREECAQLAAKICAEVEAEYHETEFAHVLDELQTDIVARIRGAA